MKDLTVSRSHKL